MCSWSATPIRQRFEAHRSTEYFKTLGRAMAEFMDGKPTIQRFKQVGA